MSSGREGVVYDGPPLNFLGIPLCAGEANCSKYISDLPDAGGDILVSGALPNGLSLLGGRVVGTPASGSAGTYSFIICFNSGCRQYSLVILPNWVDTFTFGGVLRVLRMLNSASVVARRRSWVPVEGVVTFQ